MRLAKPQVDVGLSTNRIEEKLAFRAERIGLPFDARAIALSIGIPRRCR